MLNVFSNLRPTDLSGKGALPCHTLCPYHPIQKTSDRQYITNKVVTQEFEMNELWSSWARTFSKDKKKPISHGFSFLNYNIRTKTDEASHLLSCANQVLMSYQEINVLMENSFSLKAKTCDPRHPRKTPFLKGPLLLQVPVPTQIIELTGWKPYK